VANDKFVQFGNCGQFLKLLALLGEFSGAWIFFPIAALLGGHESRLFDLEANAGDGQKDQQIGGVIS
jgi:hypothetical protein